MKHLYTGLTNETPAHVKKIQPQELQTRHPHSEEEHRTRANAGWLSTIAELRENMRLRGSLEERMKFYEEQVTK